MRLRVSMWVLLGALGLASAQAWAQFTTFRFTPPPSQRAVAGSYTVAWRQGPDRIDNGPCSVTWYYAGRADGTDRKRLTTHFRDDFASGYQANWTAQGPFLFDWGVRRDPVEDRAYLYGPPDGGPLVSNQAPDQDVVLSVLARPQTLKNRFRLELRAQRGGRSYELRNNGGSLQLVRLGQVVAERRLLRVAPRRWYWYEVGIRTVKRKDVEIRVRVLDEKRQQILVSFCHEERPPDQMLLKTGLIALWGPADFAEVYVDPWESRWCDEPQSQLRWDTSVVPNGDYFLIAELMDDKTPPHLVASDFQVQVRNAGQ